MNLELSDIFKFVALYAAHDLGKKFIDKMQTAGLNDLKDECTRESDGFRNVESKISESSFIPPQQKEQDTLEEKTTNHLLSRLNPQNLRTDPAQRMTNFEDSNFESKISESPVEDNDNNDINFHIRNIQSIIRDMEEIGNNNDRVHRHPEILRFSLRHSSNNRSGQNSDLSGSINSILDLSPNRVSYKFMKDIIDSFLFMLELQLYSNKPNCINIPNEFDDSNIPDEYKCPISKTIMKDPVIAADGNTYERELIETHLKNSSRSPLNGENLLYPLIIPNWNLRKLIETYINQNSQNLTNNVEEDTSVTDNSNEAIDLINNNIRELLRII